MMELLEDLVVYIAAIVAGEFVIAYHVKTHGAWMRSPMGRHLMAFMASIAIVLILLALDDVIEQFFFDEMPIWWEWVELSSYSLIPIVLVWRRFILYKLHRKEKEDRGGQGTGKN